MSVSKRQFLSTLCAATALCLAGPLRAQAVSNAAVVRHYAVLVRAGYEDTLAGALDLQRAVAAFVAAPDADKLAAARAAWLAAREWYGQTEAFRFYGGPVDDDKGPEGRLNSWPLDESYIDAVAGKPGAGIVNDRRLLITKANLARLNERGGEENIAAGWHAIEYLLWGQDRSADGPGNRSFEDYVDGKLPNADRRRQYLTVVTEMLVDDLRYLVGAWVPNANNYRERFERGDLESLRRIIVGLGSLSRGELAGERLEVALNTQDQEDEHSCFSDNTHRDIVNNALGVQNVWLGQFMRRDGSTLQGASLRELTASLDAALAERTSRQIAASVVAANAIQPPFDREIIGAGDAAGRRRVQSTIDSLVRQSKDLADVAAALGITRLTLVNPK
jgi:putative iron-regulated protein